MDLRKAARDPWVWGQVALFGLVVVGVPSLVRAGALGGQASETLRRPGLVLLGLGLGILAWGFGSIGRNLTPGTEPLPEGRFVSGGAYGFVRHPVYLGIVLLLAGWAWWIGNPWYGILTGAVSFAYFDRKAAVEERWMVARFPEYGQYRARVGKLLPRRR